MLTVALLNVVKLSVVAPLFIADSSGANTSIDLTDCVAIFFVGDHSEM